MTDEPPPPPPPSASGPPPGWYPDPAGSGMERWWDGTAWSLEAVRTPGDGDVADPLGGKRPRRLVVGATLLGVALLATTVVAILNGTGALAPAGRVQPGAAVPDPVSRGAVEGAFAAAGCEVLVDGRPADDRAHVDRQEAPPPEVLYADRPRPADSGRHFPRVEPLPSGVARAPIDERAVLHNQEHGAVTVWFDPAVVTADDVAALGSWQRARLAIGFTSRAGGAVFVSPAPVISSGKPFALRAWGQAVDCDRFDATVADAFLIEHYGTHGSAPEADLAPYPESALRYR